MPDSHYDIVVIGSGPGGAALAQRLAASGKTILLVERGGYLPREAENWDSRAVFVENRYQAKESWYDAKRNVFTPGLHYYVGGNSKVYGAALLRLRARDFAEVRHEDGISPAWPLQYEAFAPYYDQAERLFHVHGQAGEDPCEPARHTEFPYAPVAHEPKIETLRSRLAGDGLQPFHLPLGILLEEAGGKPTHASQCIRCKAFDGFPCLLNGKADAQTICVEPMLAAHENVTLLTNAYARKLHTDAAGTSVRAVEVEVDGAVALISADIVVVACGALSSALLMLRSANGQHPAGLANGSGQVGRNYMCHNQSVLMGLLHEPNDTTFQKTLAISDYYFGAVDYEYPLGLVQMCATMHGPQLKAEALPPWLHWVPDAPFNLMARYGMGFWLSSEDIPLPQNRIFYEGGNVVLEVTPTNTGARRHLRKTVQRALEKTGLYREIFKRGVYFSKDIPISGTSHQAGTMRFGVNPDSSVLDINCKAHELDNLYVTDASFFPSIGAVNPTLTIIANALRVADHLRERLA